MYVPAMAHTIVAVQGQQFSSIILRTMPLLLRKELLLPEWWLPMRLELLGLESWTEENKERALNLLAEYHDIFALEYGEMGCPEATEHKIEVTSPKPFKKRLRNILSGLLEEVKDHLDHMLDVGAIKPSKSAWSNAVVLVWKKDGGLRFCIDF